jgi:isochorismate pyruvate lyase
MGQNTKAGTTASEADWRVACSSLDEVRQNIDRLDAQLTALLCERHHFVMEAAKFKSSVAGVVVPERVNQIAAKVRDLAVQNGGDPDVIEKIFRSMIDIFIADEQRHWREINK